MMPRPVPVLQCDLVTLRAIDPARDADDYWRFNLDPRMHTWTGNEVLASVEEARRELERFAAMTDLTTWAIVENSARHVIGRFFICLQRRNGRLVAGEGVRVARDFWRKGHHREARRLVAGYVFDELDADCIESECWSENVNARLSLLAHGFKEIARVREFNHKHQRLLEKSLFRLTRCFC
jgi:RimJ/RimL family protein N-acetyltransferase